MSSVGNTFVIGPMSLHDSFNMKCLYRLASARNACLPFGLSLNRVYVNGQFNTTV